MRRATTLQLVELKLQRNILTAFGAVEVGKAAAGHGHVLAHVDAPCVVGVAGEEAVGADFDAVGPVQRTLATKFLGGGVRDEPDVVVVVAVIPRICIAAHCS